MIIYDHPSIKWKMEKTALFTPTAILIAVSRDYSSLKMAEVKDYFPGFLLIKPYLFSQNPV